MSYFHEEQTFGTWAFGVLVETTDGKKVMIRSRRPAELEAAIAQAVANRKLN